MSTEEYIVRLLADGSEEARKIANGLVTCWEDEHLAPEEYGSGVVRAYARADRYLAKHP